MIMDDKTLAPEHDGGFRNEYVWTTSTTSPKSLRVQGSLALQACSLLTTKQFYHLDSVQI